MLYGYILILLMLWVNSSIAAMNATIIGTGSTASYEVSVTAYGATGNDLTDDTTAIQAAIDAIPDIGGIVRFPTGTYCLSNELVIDRNNITMVGDESSGSILKICTYWNTFTSGFVAAMVNLKGPSSSTHIQNITIRGLHFYGDPHLADANEPKCISAKWADDVKMVNNSFENFGHECIWPAGNNNDTSASKNWQIISNYFANIGVGGASPSTVTLNVQDALVQGNHFDNVLAAVGASDKRAVIVGNMMKNILATGIASAGDVPGSDDVVISGNQIEVTAGANVRYGIRVIYGARNTVVIGNTIRMKSVAEASSMTGVYLQGPIGTNVIGNGIYMDTANALANGAAMIGVAGIDNGNGLDVTLNGNTFTLVNENTAYCAMVQFRVTSISHIIKVFLNGNQMRGLSRANSTYAIDFTETANGKTNYWIANNLTNSGYIKLVGTLISDSTYDNVLMNLSAIEP